MKATSNRALLLLAAIACVPLACKDGGCGGGSNNAAPTGSVTGALSASASPIASTSSSGRARMGGMRTNGVTGALFRAANGLEVKPEQKTAIDKIGADLREQEKALAEADGGAFRSELKAYHDELVTGVKSGKLDAAKMEAHLGVMETAAKARQERESDALNKLHAVLEPAQRAAAVASVRQMEEKRATRMKAREAASDGGARSFTSRARFENMIKDLALEPDQDKKVQAILPKDDPKSDMREEAKKRSDATLDAFEKDGFDAKKVNVVEPKKAVQPMADMIKFLSQLVPLLTPIQRDKLAAKVERGPGMEGRRPRMGGNDLEEEDME